MLFNIVKFISNYKFIEFQPENMSYDQSKLAASTTIEQTHFFSTCEMNFTNGRDNLGF